MSEYRSTVRVAAPPEEVFDLWVNLDRIHEWIGGVTGVSDVSGPLDRPGTRYTVHFGRMRSPSEVIEVDRPRHIRTRFGNFLLRGENEATFEPEGEGTRVRQTFRTTGFISAVSARIFASGSYKGSFQGELNEFARIAEREAGGGEAAPS
ncbi:hypothetical protein BH24CHL6_BH24CHL6_04730 [soil metagenome]